MARHIAYLKYVLRHKWYVLKYSRLVGASLWLCLIHDLSKFRPDEWLPYAACFYKPDGRKQYVESEAFTKAWNFHQKRNLHHWQAWCWVEDDSGTLKAIAMPEKYVREMVADWIGAGFAITGELEVQTWYEKSKEKMTLHPETRKRVEELLSLVKAAK